MSINSMIKSEGKGAEMGFFQQAAEKAKGYAKILEHPPCHSIVEGGTR